MQHGNAMDPFDIDFPVFVIIQASPKNPGQVALPQFNDPIHGPFLPVFTDIDLAERFMSNVIPDWVGVRSLPVKSKEALGQLLPSVIEDKCQFLTIDFFHRNKSAVATFYYIEQVLKWCL